MLANVSSGAVLGVDAYRVEVEVYISNGVPSFTVVGLGDTAVQESKERVRSAIRNSDFAFEPRRITVKMRPISVLFKTAPNAHKTRVVPHVLPHGQEMKHRVARR